MMKFLDKYSDYLDEMEYRLGFTKSLSKKLKLALWIFVLYAIPLWGVVAFVLGTYYMVLGV
jgi:hypothetical protein